MKLSKCPIYSLISPTKQLTFEEKADGINTQEKSTSDIKGQTRLVAVLIVLETLRNAKGRAYEKKAPSKTHRSKAICH